MNEEVTAATAADMRALGRRLATVLRAGDLVILSGPLGAGKTTLTQGIGDGLGIRGPVTSPTFVIARVHPPLEGARRPTAAFCSPGGGYTSDGYTGGRGDWYTGGPAGPAPVLVHADAYRLGSALELDDLDLDADTATSVTVVEWGEGLAEGLAEDRLEITIAPGPVGSADPGPGDPRPALGEELEGSARIVRLRGVGERWRDIRLPPAGVGDRL